MILIDKLRVKFFSCVVFLCVAGGFITPVFSMTETVEQAIQRYVSIIAYARKHDENLVKLLHDAGFYPMGISEYEAEANGLSVEQFFAQIIENYNSGIGSVEIIEERFYPELIQSGRSASGNREWAIFPAYMHFRLKADGSETKQCSTVIFFTENGKWVAMEMQFHVPETILIVFPDLSVAFDAPKPKCPERAGEV